MRLEIYRSGVLIASFNADKNETFSMFIRRGDDECVRIGGNGPRTNDYYVVRD